MFDIVQGFLHYESVDLGSPLRSLIPTLDSSVLEVLIGTESGLSMTQISRLASRGTRQGLALAVERLVEHGIVEATPANRGFLYRLNREHVLASVVIAASEVRAEITCRMEKEVDRLTPRPIHVSIFGSFARGGGNPGSDIDTLFVVADRKAPDDGWYAQLRSLADKVYQWTGNRMEHLTFTETEFRDVITSREPVVDSWLNESIVVAGPSIESLMARITADRATRR